MSAVAAVALPQRFLSARALRERLAARGIWFAPIRHHSPACAKATKAMIAALEPAAVLIEAPAEYDELLPALTAPATTPPVAILALRKTETGTLSSFFPLADFSPEWVALREAAARGIKTAFIDRSWIGLGAAAETSELAEERYYAQSQALTQLAHLEHCRDHDELWEHLFELRETDWQTHCDDAFAWSALARLDYETEVLLTEGSIPREAVMVDHIAKWQADTSRPLVVVTGAFHTLGLVEALGVKLFGEKIPEAEPILKHKIPNPEKADSWLIRYDLTRLNALTGYGAGIRSPGYYQRRWDVAASPKELVLNSLADIAKLTNAANTSEIISTAAVIEAALQAHRLAELRGHSFPGRTDLLDACSSCFASGELNPAIRDAIGEVFGGTKLGVLPEGTPAPPIVAEARVLAEKLRLNVSDSSRRNTTIDVRRSASGRRRSRFLWLMSFLDVGFARFIAGPDYISGRNLGRINEQWEYAWTPMVEAQLIALTTQGATLPEVARARLRASAPEPDSRSCGAVAAIIAQAALIGLSDEMTHAMIRLDQMITADVDLGSVVTTAEKLFGLWHSRDLLDIAEPQRLLRLISRVLPQVGYLLDKTADVKAEDEPAVVAACIAAHALIKDCENVASSQAELDAAADFMSTASVTAAFARLPERSDVSPGVLGAVLALGVVNSQIADELLSEKVAAIFAPGADVSYSLRFLDGLMQAAPDLFLHTPELFDAVNQAIAKLEPDAFLNFLPELRRSFGRLRPVETAKVAERIALHTGVASADIAASNLMLTAADLAAGVRLEQALRGGLIADGLDAWVEVSNE